MKYAAVGDSEHSGSVGNGAAESPQKTEQASIDVAKGGSDDSTSYSPGPDNHKDATSDRQSQQEAVQANEKEPSPDNPERPAPSDVEKKPKKLVGRLGQRNEESVEAEDGTTGENQRRSDAFKVLIQSCRQRITNH